MRIASKQREQGRRDGGQTNPSPRRAVEAEPSADVKEFKEDIEGERLLILKIIEIVVGIVKVTQTSLQSGYILATTISLRLLYRKCTFTTIRIHAQTMHRNPS